jgi:hypothetical protein
MNSIICILVFIILGILLFSYAIMFFGLYLNKKNKPPLKRIFREKFNEDDFEI